jgi:hypothetical protein
VHVTSQDETEIARQPLTGYTDREEMVAVGDDRWDFSTCENLFRREKAYDKALAATRKYIEDSIYVVKGETVLFT